MLFQGQEFLQGGWFNDHVPLDWDRAETFSGILVLYRDLIDLRLNRNGLTRGLTGQHINVHHVNDSDKLIGFHRWCDERTEHLAVALDGAGRERLVAWLEDMLLAFAAGYFQQTA
jgi:1,4-alpha-glucan branching enzyme